MLCPCTYIPYNRFFVAPDENNILNQISPSCWFLLVNRESEFWLIYAMSYETYVVWIRNHMNLCGSFYAITFLFLEVSPWNFTWKFKMGAYTTVQKKFYPKNKKVMAKKLKTTFCIFFIYMIMEDIKKKNFIKSDLSSHLIQPWWILFLDSKKQKSYG